MRRPLLVLALVVAPAAADAAVRVRIDKAARCAAPLVESFGDATIEHGAPVPARDADVLIAPERELTRYLEGGQSDLDRAVVLFPGGDGPKITAIALDASPNLAHARRLLAHLAAEDARAAFTRCRTPHAASTTRGDDVRAQGGPVPTGEFAEAVVDFWLPQCSLDNNDYDDPNEVLGVPDAARPGGPGGSFVGFMSLGQGGWVIVDLGRSVADHAGPDFRVYQTASAEPVSVYGASAPDGPFALIALRRECGGEVPGFSNGCDFDLAEGGLSSVRYLKIEDGELFPCLLSGTDNEGADIDAVELLE
jgi:hypothetical protein